MGRTAFDDDGQVWTPVMVEREIFRLCHELDELDLVGVARAGKEAEAKYKRARAANRTNTRVKVGNAKAGSGPGGRPTVDEIDDIAIMELGDMFTAYLIAEAVYESTRDAMFVKRAQIEALRTIAADLREKA